MANTYTQIYIHAVFAVKGRENLIHKWSDELYKYICGIVNSRGQKVYAINGMPDHIHILLSLKPDFKLSDLMRDIKSNSSKWVNEKRYVKGKFEWQKGFGAFSCGQSQVNTVIAYINNQENHHAKRSFQEEYLELLKRYEVDYEDQYIFESVQ